uniref:Uncharacterized protein n=1 Tax=Strix occidentalis caurina TaxID=311401 RepID=A0A8D0KU82_STROC
MHLTLCFSNVTVAPFAERGTRMVWGPRWAGRETGSCLRATKMCAVVLGSGMGLRVVYSNCQCDFQTLYLFSSCVGTYIFYQEKLISAHSLGDS